MSGGGNRPKIPASWNMVPIAEIGLAVTGNTPSKKEKRNYGSHIPFVKPPQLIDGTIESTIEYLSETGAEKGRVAPINTVFVSCIGNLGKTGTNRIPVAFNQQINAIFPSEGINSRFVFYQTQSGFFRQQLEEFSSATTISIINKGNFEKLTFRLAPTNEQRRIVAKIEELFSELDKGVESLKAARKQLKTYRQAVLKHAFEGKLTAKCTVEHIPLGNLIGPIQQGWSPKCDPNRVPDQNEWAIIKTTTVQPLRYLSNECKPLPSDLEPRSGIEIMDGDLLMTRKGPRPRTGVVCLVRGVRKKSMLCDTVYRFRADENQVSPEFLEVALNSPRVVEEINAKKSGISESGISLNHGKIKSVLIPVVMPKEFQNRIVLVMREKFSLIEKLEQEIGTQLQKSEALRQSILKKAFSGQLVPQDSSDEAASVLLERIRAEKATQAKSKAKRKTRKRKDAA